MRFNQDAFMSGIKMTQDRQAGKKSLDQAAELARLKSAEEERLMNLKFQLQDKALTPELKLFNLNQEKPEEFASYMKARNPYGMDEAAYRQAMLGLASQRLQLDKTIKTNPPPAPVQPSDFEKRVNFLMKKGMTFEQATEYLKAGGKKEDTMPNFLQNLDLTKYGPR
jgi:hypothetical protein